LKRKHKLIYSSTRDKQILDVTYYLEAIDAQEKGGPIHPVYTSDFVFPVPIFSISVNNPSLYPLFFTEIRLRVDAAPSLSIPWLILAEPILDFDKGHFGFGLDNFGWGEISSDITVDYELAKYPTNGPSGHVCCVPELSYLASLPGVNWDAPLSHNTTLSLDRQLSSESVQTFDGPIDREALVPFSKDKIAVLFGTLHYNVGNNSKQTKFVTRIFFENPGGPGRAKPSYKYSVEIDPDLPPRTITIPISQVVESNNHDEFLLSLFTKKPAKLSFDISLRLSTGEYMEAGKVSLETFYPKFYDAGGIPKRIISPVVSLGNP
jgi:hypothetical protein